MAFTNANDKSRTQRLYGGTISLIVLATLAVIARLAARKITVAGLWWDDLILVIALILVWGLSCCYWVEVEYGGLGYHTVAFGGPVDQGKQDKFYQIFPAVQILYFASSFAIKTSLLLFYYRIFGIVRWFRNLLFTVWFIALLYFVVFFFVTLFECHPVAYYWDKSIRGGTCIDQKQFYRWNGIINLLIDFVIWSLTFPMIWQLKLDVKQKLSISAVFLIGLIACIASIIRVVTFNQVSFDDITFTLVTASIWTAVEQSVGIICASLPTVRPLIDHFFPNAVGNRHRHSHSTRSSANLVDAIPLPNYGNRTDIERPFDTPPGRTGFARLDSDTMRGANRSVTATAAVAEKCLNDGLPPIVMPSRKILKQQKFEQHIDDSGSWSG